MLPVVVLARWRVLWRLEASTPVPEAEYDLLRGSACSRRCRWSRIEELARRASHVGFAAGATIIREGEPGDRFYVIAGGVGGGDRARALPPHRGGRRVLRRDRAAARGAAHRDRRRRAPTSSCSRSTARSSSPRSPATGARWPPGHDLVEERLAAGLSPGSRSSPEEMRALGYRAVDLLVARLTDPSIPALRRATPAEMAARLSEPPPAAPSGLRRRARAAVGATSCRT